jgi:F-type H+-transporting ATPase subunit b
VNYDTIAFWSQIAGFVLFVVFLIWAMMKWINPALASAQKASNERIALAERHRDEMKAALESLRHEIDGAKRDAQTILERAKERAQHERDAIVADARVSGERLVHNAQGELERARNAARARMREDLASKALDIARQSAMQRIDVTVNSRLLAEFLEQVSRG